jgi:hypothetical protein
MGMIINPYNFKVPLLLDTYTGAKGAWSVRLLRTAYTGYCMKVRRDSDNTEQDIGFVSGLLDTTSLLTFCGAGSGYVRTWYDQSGNNYHLNQTNTARQLRVVSSGSVITSYGSKPTLLSSDRNGFDGLLKTNWKFIHTLQATISFVFDYVSSGIFLICSTDAVYSTFTRVGISITYKGFEIGNGGGTGDVIAHASNNPEGHILWDYDCTDANAVSRSKLSVNNSDLADNSYNESPSTSDSYANLMIIGRRDGESESNGKWQEIIIWDSRKNNDRTGIKTNTNSFYSIY